MLDVSHKIILRAIGDENEAISHETKHMRNFQCLRNIIVKTVVKIWITRFSYKNQHIRIY